MAHSRGEAVKSLVSKRSIVIAGHKTSVSLEDQFWNSLKEIADGGTGTARRVAGAVNRARRHAWAQVVARHGALPGVRRPQ